MIAPSTSRTNGATYGYSLCHLRLQPLSPTVTASVTYGYRLGGDCAVDISYQWLTFFLHDDAKLKHIHDEYASGRMLSGT